MAGERYFQFDVTDSRYSITGLDSKSIGKMVFAGYGLRKLFGKILKSLISIRKSSIMHKTPISKRTTWVRVVLFLVE